MDAAPPGFVRNAVENEACHGKAQRAKPGIISTRAPRIVSNYALASQKHVDANDLITA
jgi:hypothetical protein